MSPDTINIESITCPSMDIARGMLDHIAKLYPIKNVKLQVQSSVTAEPGAVTISGEFFVKDALPGTHESKPAERKAETGTDEYEPDVVIYEEASSTAKIFLSTDDIYAMAETNSNYDTPRADSYILDEFLFIPCNFPEFPKCEIVILLTCHQPSIVCNIIPVEISQLSSNDYNGIMKKFIRDCTNYYALKIGVNASCLMEK